MKMPSSFKLVSTLVLMLSTSTVDMLSDGRRRVVATFTNLLENRKYSASVYVQVNGGRLIQQPPSVEISEW